MSGSCWTTGTFDLTNFLLFISRSNEEETSSEILRAGLKNRTACGWFKRLQAPAGLTEFVIGLRGSSGSPLEGLVFTSRVSMEDDMKHHELTQLQTLAKVGRDYPGQVLSREKRLLRWTELLEGNPERLLSTLQETEFKPASVRAAMRCDNSAISVAFNDPLLRAAGLGNDTYGEAKRFFELSDGQLHRIVCYCHFGMTVSAERTARYIRTKHVDRPDGFFDRLRGLFAW
jgi:hypothetical protein